MVKEWKRREVIKDRDKIVSQFPSFLTYISGMKNGVPTIKFFLKEDDKNAKKYFRSICEAVQLKPDFFVVRNNKKELEQSSENNVKQNIRTKFSKEFEMERKKLLQIIEIHEDRLLASYSNLVGIGLRIENEDGCQLTTPRIELFCLDKMIVPFGERRLPKYLEGHSVLISEDFYMFLSCQNCNSLNNGCSIGRHYDNSAGSIGFFFKNCLSERGFLTAAHVALNNKELNELYDSTELFSKRNNGSNHQIVHPSYQEKIDAKIIGNVSEAFCGNHEQKLGGFQYTGIDAAFVKCTSEVGEGMLKF